MRSQSLRHLPFSPRSRLVCFLSLSASGSTQTARSLHLSTLASTRTAAALTAVRIKQPLLNRASRHRFPIIRPHIAAASACLHSKRSARRSRLYRDSLSATSLGPDLLSTTNLFPTNSSISSVRIFPPSRVPSFSPSPLVLNAMIGHIATVCGFLLTSSVS